MAAGLVAELKESFGVQAQLIEGDKGIFDVKAAAAENQFFVNFRRHFLNLKIVYVVIL